MTLKQKTINGLKWSFIDNTARLGLSFIIGIILARLLSPREFGLIGMITIFIALAAPFVNSGFSQALIRKQNCTQADYSTIFYFNLLIGLLFYLLLFFTAGVISRFFNEPLLKPMVRVLSLGIIINAFSLIQTTRLTKQIDFKLQTNISIIASVVSGTLGIAMAYYGYGVWSLVAKTIIGYLFTTIFLWYWNKWIPSLVFSVSSFKELFSFGSKLLIVGIIDTIYSNMYLLVIGKFFSASELGYYTRADQFKGYPSENITGVIQRVSYPVLSSIQNEPENLKNYFRKLISSTMLITFVLMIGMAAVAKPLVLTLIGQKWLPSVAYLQLLCFVGMLYPLHALNLVMLNVLGRTDLFLKLELLKKALFVPVIFAGILVSIKVMILAMLVHSIFSYYLNSYYTGKLMKYPIRSQLSDIFKPFLLALTVGLAVYPINHLLHSHHALTLIIQIVVGSALTFIIAEIFKLESYVFIKRTLIDKFKK